MASSTEALPLEKVLAKLVELRRARESRDYFAYSKTLLDAVDILKKRFGGWVDSELKDLSAQAEILVQVSEGQAKENLNAIVSELEEIKNRKLPQANRNLQNFAKKMKSKKLSKTSEVIHSVVDDVEPSVSIITRLNEMRGQIDSLADMTLSIGGTIEEVTPHEEKDIQSSLEDVSQGRVKKSAKANEIIDFLHSD